MPSREYRTILRESSDADLDTSASILGGQRNAAIFVGAAATVVIVWAGWSLWFLAAPALFLAGAVNYHTHLSAIREEISGRLASRLSGHSDRS